MDDSYKKLLICLQDLTSLKLNLPQQDSVSEDFVQEYHIILDRLAGIGINVEEFRVPKNKYTNPKGVKLEYLKFKISSLLKLSQDIMF